MLTPYNAIAAVYTLPFINMHFDIDFIIIMQYNINDK